MSLITSSIKGTLDLLPKDSYKTQYVEAAMREIAENYGFYEMRTPVAAIEGYLALSLNDAVCKVDSKAREYLEKAHQSTGQLGKLFQDL